MVQIISRRLPLGGSIRHLREMRFPPQGMLCLTSYRLELVNVALLPSPVLPVTVPLFHSNLTRADGSLAIFRRFQRISTLTSYRLALAISLPLSGRFILRPPSISSGQSSIPPVALYVWGPVLVSANETDPCQSSAQTGKLALTFAFANVVNVGSTSGFQARGNPQIINSSCLFLGITPNFNFQGRGAANDDVRRSSCLASRLPLSACRPLCVSDGSPLPCPSFLSCILGETSSPFQSSPVGTVPPFGRKPLHRSAVRKGII